MIVAEVLRKTGVPNQKEPGDQEQEGQGSQSSGISSGRYSLVLRTSVLSY